VELDINTSHQLRLQLQARILTLCRRATGLAIRQRTVTQVPREVVGPCNVTHPCSYSCSSSLSLTTIANTKLKRNILCSAMRDLGKIHTETCANLGPSLSSLRDNVAASVLQLMSRQRTYPSNTLHHLIQLCIPYCDQYVLHATPLTLTHLRSISTSHHAVNRHKAQHRWI
jgi:hypothetical protein